jgi:hypothetical protein
MSKAIRIYRKSSADEAVAKMSKADRDAFLARVEAVSRVPRPDVLAHFLPSGSGRSAFHRQEAISPALAANRAVRVLDHADKGWTVPAGNLGRVGAPTASAAQSVLLWLKLHVVSAGLCSADELCVVVEDV